MSFTVAYLYPVLLFCLGSQSMLINNPTPPPYNNVVGPRGLPGTIGQTGAPGAPGAAGPSGPPGRTGEPGPVGPRGMPGENGLNGAKGMQGLTGPKGDPGVDGADGSQGQKGQTGAQGPVGNQGIKGDKGAKGWKGERGLQGPPGLVPSQEITKLKELVNSLSVSVQSLQGQVVSINAALSGLKWVYINKSKVIHLSRNQRLEESFLISDYGYDPSLYEFLEVEINARATGDLNSQSEYLLTYFNSVQVGDQWNSGFDDSDLHQLDAYPIQRPVEASSFIVAVFTSNGVSSGLIEFTLVRFRVTKK